MARAVGVFVVFVVVLAVTLLSLGPLAEREFVSYDDLHNFVHSRAAGGLRALLIRLFPVTFHAQRLPIFVDILSP